MKTCLNCHTENSDDAEYCKVCRFTLDWATEADDPKSVIKPVLPSLDLALGPGDAHVAAGQTTVFDVRVVNRGARPATVTLRVAGPAAAYSRVQPETVEVAPDATGEANLSVSVPAGTAAQAMAVELYATEASTPGGSVTAQASLVVDPPSVPPVQTPPVLPTPPVVQTPPVVPTPPVVRTPPVQPPPVQPQPADAPKGRPRWVVPTSLAGLVAVLGGIAAIVLGSSSGGDIDGRVTAEKGACVHTQPNLDPSTRIPAPPPPDGCQGPGHNQNIKIDCAPNDQVFKLADPFSGKFIARGLVTDLSGNVPNC